MKRLLGVLLLGSLASAICASIVWAQATAQISGTVKDQSGAVLPGAEVAVTQTETGITRNVVTDEIGAFEVPNLAIGPYRVEVSLPGFRTFVQTGIVLQVNSNPVINAVLQVGQVTETVEVAANAALVETRSVGVGNVIENERILELPLNGRNVTDLIVLAGAAVVNAGGGSSSRSMAGQQAISVAGGQSYGVAYILDGAMHNNPYDNLSLPLPFPDALQEFRVETGGLSAQNGMHAGASVNSVTKSGTNQFHGNLFEFVRNDLFNARSYYSETRSTLKRNQFGGTLGGPIVSNRVFFFGGYQGTTLRQDPTDSLSYVPTAQMLAGDFTVAASAQCRAAGAITLRAPFDQTPGNQNKINPALFSKAALNIVSRLPKSNHPCGEVRWGTRDSDNNGQFIGKIDYQRSSRHSIFGRYLATTQNTELPYKGEQDNLLTASDSGQNNLAQSYTLGDTFLISPNTVNAFRLTVNRTAIARTGSEFFSPRDVGINVFSYLPKYTVLTVSNPGFSIGSAIATDATFRTTTYAVSEDVSLIRGSHQFSFGGNLAHWRSNGNAAVFGTPNLSFTATQAGPGLSMADFLLGNLTSMTASAPTTLYMRQWYLGLYAQDTWKARPRLTLNYGLRWEPLFPQEITNGYIYNFDETRFLQGSKSTVYKTAPAGFYYPGDPGFPGRTGMNKQWMTLGPRVGFAWDPKGDGRSSVRGSYSIAYEFVNGQYHLNTAAASPWGARFTAPNPTGGLDNPWRDIPGGDPFPLNFGDNAFFSQYGVFNTMNYDTKSTTVSSWNLSLQKQLGGNRLVSASYIGNSTIHLWTSKELNPATYIPGSSTLTNINARRKYSLLRPLDGQYIGYMALIDDGGTQSYHGLLVSAQQRAGNVTVNGNYTWAHCIGNASNGGGAPNSGTGGDTYYPLDNRAADRANCGSDRRHVFNLTTVLESPEFANPTLRKIGSGWRLSTIYRLSSGSWLTVTSGVDTALSGVGGQRPIQVLENPYGDREKTRDRASTTTYLNRAAFQLPAQGNYGTLGRATIEGVGSWQFDTALSRMFRFRETQRLEFRAEAYNVTNSYRKGNPNTNLNSSDFGRITAAGGGPRILQFAMKYLF